MNTATSPDLPYDLVLTEEMHWPECAEGGE